MTRFNFHHLHYFWAVAKDGQLTRTAKRLRVSQSALSSQIAQLEAQFGRPLFERVGRGLALSETGKIVLEYADQIFATGDELLATLTFGRAKEQVLRVGAVATLSRNFQESFIKPLLGNAAVKLRLQSGRFDELLDALGDHALDLVLANRPARQEPKRAWRSRRIARQRVSIIGNARAKPFRFGHELQGRPMILPGPDSEIRAEFEAICQQRRLKVSVLAEVDDMATMRLLAQDTDALSLLPAIVVRDEIRNGVLRELCAVPDLFEAFYAITVERHFQHPLLGSLLARDEVDMLEMDPKGSPSSSRT